jgi:lysophospholipase L1-like esterase
VLSVRSFDLKTEYVEGVDYEIKDGRIYRLEGSEMPHFTWDEFYPKSKETSVSGNVFAGSEKPYVIFSEGTYFHKNQVFVTYTHAANTDLFVPQRSAKLNKFVEKLEKGESVSLVFFGDSITAGGNSSGRGNTAPFTPRWSEIVRDALAAKYPSAKINFTNTAVGGKETVWGISEIDNSVNKYKPDLLVLAFGMNDGGKSTDQFIANTRTMIDKVLAANPDCEILVIGTMLPHSETTYFKNQYLQEAGLYEMAKSYKNVDVVPMTSMHSSILEHKRYFDMTGNNVNHPNDFLIRAYAQTILKTIIG